MKYIKTQMEVLDELEIERIHDATARILSSTGIKTPNRRVLEMAAEAGAEVDFHTEVMKLPRAVLDDFIEKCKKSSKFDDGIFHKARAICGKVSTQVHLIDPIAKVRRAGIMEDVYKGFALAPHLSNIEAGFAVVIPSDIPGNITDLALYRALYKYTACERGTYILSPQTAVYIVEMAKLCGKRTSYLLETVSPLRFRPESLEIALIMAKAGHEITVGPMVMAGASGPVTIAGTLVMLNAEILGSLFLAAILNGQYEAGYFHGTHNMELKNMLCSFGNPGQAFYAIASAQMGRHYGLWATSNSALTDALTPDFQAGAEKGITGTISALCGCVNVGCQGITGADQGFSFEQLVLDDEWLSYLKHITRGFEVNDETIACGLIEEVGIGGDYFSEEHTVEHMRDTMYHDRLFSRNFWNDGAKENDNGDLLLRAREFVNEKIKNHHECELMVDRETACEMDKIYTAAQKNLIK